ncbi:MAG: T9SS type A sorting domain-containing protein [Chitinophagales bacterium]
MFDDLYPYNATLLAINAELQLVAALIFPNPVHDYLFIHPGIINGQLREISVLDLAGKKLLGKELMKSSGEGIDVSILLPGEYLCKLVDTETGAYCVRKFIKN